MPRRHRVAVLATSGSTLFETGIALETLGFDWGDGLLYDVTVHGETPTIEVDGGAVLQTEWQLADAAGADTIVVPGTKDLTGPYGDELLGTLREAQAAGRRVVSICTGAFVLAAAGLLDGRSATTHWRRCGLLRTMYPGTLVLGDRLYVDGGDGVVTGAGSVAGVDLCLHLIREDHGVEAANAVARRLVVSAHRPGGQAQFARHEPLEAAAGWLTDLGDWVDGHLDDDLTVGRLADAAGMSSRTLARRFADEVGLPPARWVVERRVDRARSLLEATDLPVDVVGARAGFRAAPTFRAAFRRVVGLSPGLYRAQHRAPSRG